MKLEKEIYDIYGEYIEGVDIYENYSSISMPRIVIKKMYRNLGIGSAIMKYIVKYADTYNKIITLTPSSDFGGNLNRLITFYKTFGFVPNKGKNKNYEFSDSMIRYPQKLKNEDSSVIKLMLRERILTKKERDVLEVSDFINFAKNYLGITDDIKIYLAYERTDDIKTTAYYDLNKKIKVYVKDRAIIDVLRSIGHELVHHKQNLENKITNIGEDGDDGSNIENEANAIAGLLVRKWGKINPNIYV